MQKFTRPITREIDLNGQRLAVTFNEQGLSFRPVGTRKPPREMTWADVLAPALEAAPPAAKSGEPFVPPPPAQVVAPPAPQEPAPSLGH